MVLWEMTSWQHDELMELLETSGWMRYGSNDLAYPGVMKQVRQVWMPTCMGEETTCLASIVFLYSFSKNYLLIVENGIPVPLLFKVTGSSVYLYRAYVTHWLQPWTWFSSWELRVKVQELLERIRNEETECLSHPAEIE